MASPNPSGGGIGQAAGELLKEMQKAQADLQVEQKQKQTQGPNQAFMQAMQAQQQTMQHGQAQSQSTQAAGLKEQGARVQGNEAINEAKKDDLRRDKLATTRVGSAERGAETKLTGMLQNLLSGQDKMTKIMDMALSGRQFGPSELLAMQAGVYRFTQELDLTSKVVEKATSGIKQTLNTQV